MYLLCHFVFFLPILPYKYEDVRIGFHRQIFFINVLHISVKLLFTENIEEPLKSDSYINYTRFIEQAHLDLLYLCNALTDWLLKKILIVIDGSSALCWTQAAGKIHGRRGRTRRRRPQKGQGREEEGRSGRVLVRKLAS